MKNREMLMRSRDKSVEQERELDLGSASEFDEEDTGIESVTLENERRWFEKEEKNFWDSFNVLQQELLKLVSSNSDEACISYINSTSTRKLASVKDHLKRTMLHVAVERNEFNLVKFFVDVGLNVNEKEGCGATSLSIAVLLKNTRICKVLVDAGAKHSGPLYTSIPSPLQMAEKLEIEDIIDLFMEDSAFSDEENLLIQRLDKTLSKGATENVTPTSDDKLNRTCPGFVTPVVGDVGTCKINNAVMSRSSSHRWVGLCPGDLHNKGYFCEAVYKVHATSGFHYILAEIMKRNRLTKEVFKRKKFQEANLVKVREAINDACRAYGIAAAIEFSASKYFPVNEELAFDTNGRLLLQRFKEWLKVSSEDDVAFRHRSTTFNFYGPLQRMYDAATAHGDGVAREAVYQAQLPVYAQLGFRNYYAEVFRHVVNFLAKWPSVTRSLMQKNCCINLLGKKGHGIELDAYVESEVVQPMKMYATGHSTVNMCERLMANIDLLKSVRRAYMNKQAFDVHKTSHHSVQSSLPDQIKGAWFCVQKEFFRNKKRTEIECYPVDSKGNASGKVPKNLVDVIDKGKEKITSSFMENLYECFPDLR